MFSEFSTYENHGMRKSTGINELMLILKYEKELDDPAWRIIPGLGSVVDNHGGSFRPLDLGVVGPLPNGLFMAGCSVSQPDWLPFLTNLAEERDRERAEKGEAEYLASWCASILVIGSLT